MKLTIAVTQTVEVTLDETKFTPNGTGRNPHGIRPRTLAQHAKHLAQLYARGLDRDFIEGYGPAKDFGIEFKSIDQDEEIV